MIHNIFKSVCGVYLTISEIPMLMTTTAVIGMCFGTYTLKFSRCFYAGR